MQSQEHQGLSTTGNISTDSDPTDLKNLKDGGVNSINDLDMNIEAKTSAFEATEREMQDVRLLCRLI